MSKALYRKYRSKSLAEIVGQAHVTDVLARSLAQGRVAHAYLLTGPRGVGKTSIARILAYEINKLPYDETASHLDIIEIDAASNNGVEDVRDLREKVQIAPVSASKKVYIIDEVHMLSKQAFNALLKTLEEPPEHAVFILATTDVDKLPPTIISRTQRFSFRAIAPQDAVKHLKHIASSEKIKIDDDALEIIATRGDGSFRDSISLLDQLQSLADKKTGITRELVELSLGLAPAEHVEKLLTAYESKDLKTIVTLLDESDQSGIQPNVLVSQLIQAVRAKIAEKPQLLDLLDQLLEVSKSSQPNIKLLTVLAAHATAKPKTAALVAPLPEISAPVAELVKNKKGNFSSNPAPTPLPSRSTANLRHASASDVSLQSAELAVAQTSSPGQETPLAKTGQIAGVSLPDGGVETDAQSEAKANRSSESAKQVSSRSAISFTKHLQPELEATSGPEFKPGAKPFYETGGRRGEQDNEQNETAPINFNWQTLIDYTRQNFVAVYSVLSKCSYEQTGATLTLYTGNAFYKKKLDDSKHRANLAKALAATGAEGLAIETIPTPPPPKDSTAAAVAAIMGGGEEVKVDA